MTPLRKITPIIFFLLLCASFISDSFGLPAQDVQVVTDAQYFQVAKKMIQEAKTSDSGDDV